MFLCLLAFSASSAAQTRTISIQAENQTVASVLKTIEQQSGYTFFYNDAAFDKSRRISISASGKDVLDVVREVFRGTDISASIIEGNIVLSQQPKAAGEQQKATAGQIRGRVVDSDGLPLPGASVFIKDTQTGAVTDNNGNFSFNGTLDGQILVASCLGYQNYEIQLSDKTTFPLRITLKETSYQIDEVVIKPQKEKYTKKGNPAVELASEIIGRKNQDNPFNNEYVSRDRYETYVVALDNFTEEKQQQAMLQASAEVTATMNDTWTEHDI